MNSAPWCSHKGRPARYYCFQTPMPQCEKGAWRSKDSHYWSCNFHLLTENPPRHSLANRFPHCIRNDRLTHTPRPRAPPDLTQRHPPPHPKARSHPRPPPLDPDPHAPPSHPLPHHPRAHSRSTRSHPLQPEHALLLALRLHRCTAHLPVQGVKCTLVSGAVPSCRGAGCGVSPRGGLAERVRCFGELYLAVRMA